MRRRLLCALVALLLGTRPAHAEPAAIEASYDRAFSLRASGKDQEALAVLEEIDREHPSGRSRAQMALAEQALGRWVEAESHLASALERGGPWITERRAILTKSLATIREHVGTLELDVTSEAGAPVTAEILADGHHVGATPLREALRLRSGRIALEVRAEGYESVRREVTITGGQLTREPVKLAPLRAPLPPVPAAPLVEERRSSPASEPPASSPWRTVGIVGIGVGGAALAASGVLALVARSTFTDARDRCGTSGCSPDVVDDGERAFDIANGATVALVAGAVLVVAGGALWLLAPRHRSAGAPGAHGLALRW